MKIKLNRILVTLLVTATFSAYAQDDKFRVVTTAVPILQISPDARAGGMGDVGVASLPDANVIFWNPAKLAFLGEGCVKAFAKLYTMVSRLVPDIDLAYFSYVTSLGDRQGLGFIALF
jgi:hypothetical protein